MHFALRFSAAITYKRIVFLPVGCVRSGDGAGVLSVPGSPTHLNTLKQITSQID